MQDYTVCDYMRSVMEQDCAPIVICNVDHTVVYMNPAAIRRYEKAGGVSMIGRSILDCHGPRGVEMIEKVVDWFKESRDHNRILESYNSKENKDVYMIALRDVNERLIGYYEKHEYRTKESDICYNF